MFPLDIGRPMLGMKFLRWVIMGLSMNKIVKFVDLMYFPQ